MKDNSKAIFKKRHVDANQGDNNNSTTMVTAEIHLPVLTLPQLNVTRTQSSSSSSDCQSSTVSPTNSYSISSSSSSSFDYNESDLKLLYRRSKSRKSTKTLKLSGLFVVVCVLSAAVLAWMMGTVMNLCLRKTHVKKTIITNLSSVSDDDNSSNNMPEIINMGNTAVPNTVYSSKDFRLSKQGKSVTSSSNQHIAVYPNDSSSDNGGLWMDLNGIGKHFTVDIKNVDGSFLNNSAKLARAIIDFYTFTSDDSHLLSYHCHAMHPSGISCAGIGFKSHLTFHTWPEDGVITLDYLTFYHDDEEEDALLLIEKLQQLFGVAIHDNNISNVLHPMPSPESLWGVDYRGFKKFQRGDTIMNDLGEYYLDSSELNMKDKVASVKTPFQQVDVYDILDPRTRTMLSYKRSLLSNTSNEFYESRHPEFFRPNRIVLLDGVIQSTSYGDEAYHEALVHPGLFAHRNPQRVAIIGGGEGATLREVLRHHTVDTCTMIEIDAGMVEASRTFLPEWSDCSDIEGLDGGNCFDDSHTRLYLEDALAWFMSRYNTGDDSEQQEEQEQLFDVVIMDALDPGDDVPFAEVLYSNHKFFETLYESLTNDGVLVMQLGEADSFVDPPDAYLQNQNRANLLRILDDIGFQAMHVYEEAHGGFLGPWQFVVVCKSADGYCDDEWYSSPENVEQKILDRIRPRKSGQSALQHFDGATMHQYHYPHKVLETLYCRQSPLPSECFSFNQSADGIRFVDKENMKINDHIYNPVRERHFVDV